MFNHQSIIIIITAIYGPISFVRSMMISIIPISAVIYHFPLPLHTYQSQSLGTSGLVTPSFSTSTTTVGAMKHGLVIMRVKATEDSLSVRVSMCVDTTNGWVDSSALYLQSLW
jgi:hypothetical protein